MNTKNASLVAQQSGAVSLHDADLMRVLQSSLYPGASHESIGMVMSYCKAAGLDPLQKPVHIVPMWDKGAGKMRDVVMPGVGLYRTQAARNGCAGISEPEFGPDKTETIGGQQITYPTWCRVTVKRRQSSGAVDEFTAREFWIENYAQRGGKEQSPAPNAMWTKRPYGQLAKCAEAQALRKAFPEIGSQPTAEEMEGKAVEAGALHMVERVGSAQADIGDILAALIDIADDASVLKFWQEKRELLKDDADAYNRLKQAVADHRRAIAGSAIND